MATGSAARVGGSLSPYQSNPLDLNPLRDLLQDQIDFQRRRRQGPTEGVRLGHPRAHRRAP